MVGKFFIIIRKKITENLIEFNKLYNDVKLYIVCPKEDVDTFKESLIELNKIYKKEPDFFGVIQKILSH